MIVLDDAQRTWGEAQLAWLAAELGAKEHKAVGGISEPEPAIVLGSADLNAQIAAGDGAAAEAVAQTLIDGGASAYFYDAPEQNLEQTLRGSSIPTFGSGTLGYVTAVSADEQDFLGAERLPAA